MNIDDFNKIQNVEVSPFLFAKIQYRIQQTAAVLPVKWVWRLGAALVLVMLLNLSAISKLDSRKQDAAAFAAAMHLSSNNNLY